MKLLLLLLLAVSANAQLLPHKVKDKDNQDNFDYLIQTIKGVQSGSLGSISGPYILKTQAFGGDVSGTYDALLVTDDSHAHSPATLSGVITSTQVLKNRIDQIALSTGTLFVFATTATVRLDGLQVATTTLYNFMSTTTLTLYQFMSTTSLHIYDLDVTTADIYDTAAFLASSQSFTGVNAFRGGVNFKTGPVTFSDGSSVTLRNEGLGLFNNLAGAVVLELIPTGDIYIRFGLDASTISVNDAYALYGIDAATVTARDAFYGDGQYLLNIASGASSIAISTGVLKAQINAVARSTGAMWVALTTAVYTTNIYSNPIWLDTLSSSKVTGVAYSSNSYLFQWSTNTLSYSALAGTNTWTGSNTFLSTISVSGGGPDITSFSVDGDTFTISAGTIGMGTRYAGARFSIYKNQGAYTPSSGQYGQVVIGGGTTAGDYSGISFSNGYSSNGLFLVSNHPTNSGDMVFASYDGATNAERVRIKNNGDIGIKNTPEYALDVTGGGRFTSTVTASEYYGDGSNLTGVIHSSSAYLTSPATFTYLANPATFTILTGNYLTNPATFTYLANPATFTILTGSYLTSPATFTYLSNPATFTILTGSYLISPATFSYLFAPATFTITGGGGDNFGSHVATQAVTINYPTTIGSSLTVRGAYTSTSPVNASYYQIGGSTVIYLPAGSLVGNLAIGQYAGYNLSFDNYNTFIGYKAGYSQTGGVDGNTFIGYKSGQLSTGGMNLFIGYNTGASNTTGAGNIFIGGASGEENTTGQGNTFIGRTCGNDNTTGAYNLALGYESLVFNKTGSANVAIGYRVGGGSFGASTSSNTMIGYLSGSGGITGNDNTLIGFKSGYEITTGTGNIVIGYNQGTSGATANNEMNIGGILKGNLNPGGGITISSLTVLNASTIRGPLSVWGAISSTSSATVSTLTVTGNAFSVGGVDIISQIGAHAAALSTATYQNGNHSFGTLGASTMTIRGASGKYGLSTSSGVSLADGFLTTTQSGLSKYLGIGANVTNTWLWRSLAQITGYRWAGLSFRNTDTSRQFDIGVHDEDLYITDAAGPTDFVKIYGATGNAWFNGNVGIGTSPGKKLDVVGAYTNSEYGSQLHLHTTENAAGIYMGSWATSYGSIAQGAYYDTSYKFIAKTANPALINFYAGNIRFFTDTGKTLDAQYTPTERMVIQNNGNVGIGNTAPARLLSIKAGAACSDIAAGEFAFATCSSKELKENIQYFPADSQKFAQLKPAKFNFKIDKSSDSNHPDPYQVASSTTTYGMIAEDVKAIYPDMRDGMIDWNFIFVQMVGTIQDLQKRIEALENK